MSESSYRPPRAGARRPRRRTTRKRSRPRSSSRATSTRSTCRARSSRSSQTRLTDFHVQPLPGPDRARACASSSPRPTASSPRTCSSATAATSSSSTCCSRGAGRAASCSTCRRRSRCTGSTRRSPAPRSSSIPRLADFSIDEEAVLERVAEGDIDIVVVANPNNPPAGCARVVPHRPAQRHRRARARRRGVLRVLAPHDAPAHGAPPEPRHPADVLQGVLARGAARGLPARARRRRARAHEGAPAVLGRRVRAVGRRDGLPRAHGLRAAASATSCAAATSSCTGSRCSTASRSSPPRRTSCCSA